MGILSGHTTPQAKPFSNIARYFTNPTQSVPPLYDHGVQVFNSADEAERVMASAHERFFCRSGETAAAAVGMERSVLNGSERTDGCSTAAFK